MSGLHLSSAFFFLGLIAAQAIASAQITTSQGAFLGADDEQFVSFKGIPYALPPTGGRRWLAPAPAPVHDGIRQATSFGPNCPQQEPVSPGQPTRAMAEDCLTLNVWSPPIGEVKRPVMVWIHGGGFRSGSGDMRGELIASEGLVVVSINYRLGPLGFFAHKSLEDFPANPGLLDIELALQWVQDNIAAFGGDPRNVTIFGVSAGGMAVNLLMASDNARGLFAKAIAHSGYATWALPRSRSAPNPAPRSIAMATAQSAEGLASKLIGRISSAPQSRELLYGLDALDLVNALEEFQLPIVDGTSIKEEPAIRFLRGEQRRVPFITGGSSFEGSVMPYSGMSPEAYTEALGGDINTARTLYLADPEAIWLQRMWGDNRYLTSARLIASAMARVEAPAWLYYADFVPDAQKGKVPGATHGSDAHYLWGGQLSPDPGTQRFAKAMRDYWFNFARSGNPNGESLPAWPQYDPQSDRWLVLSDPPAVQSDVIKGRLDFLERRYRQRVGSLLPGQQK